MTVSICRKTLLFFLSLIYLEVLEDEIRKVSAVVCSPHNLENSGWVEVIGCAVWEGGILFPLLPLLRAFLGQGEGGGTIISKSRWEYLSNAAVS